MASYQEVRARVGAALGAEDPRKAYGELVQKGLGDLSGLSEQEILFLMSEFAGNTCVITRGLDESQRAIAWNGMVGGLLLRRT